MQSEFVDQFKALNPIVDGKPTKLGTDTARNYLKLVSFLLNQKERRPFEADGRLKDEWLLSIIIYGEFDILSRSVREVALEALSWQYQSTTFRDGCGSTGKAGCDTIWEQMKWLLGLQFIRTNKMAEFAAKSEKYMSEAQRVKSGIPWNRGVVVWGNYRLGSGLDLYENARVTAQRNGQDPNGVCAPWWNGEGASCNFNKGRPYTAIQDSDILFVPYAGFVVLTASQNHACDVSCKGW
jgi:hypothetical protein